MLLQIDTTTDTTKSLRAIAALLIQACDARDGDVIERIASPTPAEVFGRQPPAPPPVVDVDRANYEAYEDAGGSAPPPPPTATVVELVATAPVGERDSAGVVYDPAIHSSSRAKVKDGTWKKRRNAGGDATPVPAPVVVAPVATTPAPPPPPPVVVAASAPVAAAPAESAPPPPPAPAGPTFRSLMAKVTEAVTTGKITNDRVHEIAVAAGAPGILACNGMAHLVPQIDAAINVELAGK